MAEVWAMLSKDRRGRIWAEIDSILWADWDPIGVNSDPQARDEYFRYVGNVMSCLCNEGSAADVAKRLGKSRTGAMGLPANAEADQRVAEACAKVWREVIGETISHPLAPSLKDEPL